MDVVTHVLVGFAAAAALAMLLGRRAQAWGPMAGLAALAPDLDVVLVPLSWIGPLYPLQHRGITHSLLGAPLMAAAVVALAGRLSRRFARLETFRWRRGHVVPLLVGAWSHLLLDVVTHQGAPLLWPLSERRWSLEVYYWIIWWLAPFSLFPLWLRFRGRFDDRRVVQAAALVLVVVLLVGAIRLDQKPEGEHVYAQRDPFHWLVATHEGNGTWRMERVEHNQVVQAQRYIPHLPHGSAGAAALVLETYAYRDFRFDSTAPHVVVAQSAGEGWDITVIDIVQRFEATTGHPLRLRLDPHAGLLRAHVEEGRVDIQHRWF